MALVPAEMATATAAAPAKPRYFCTAAVTTTPPVRYSGTAAIHGIMYRSSCAEQRSAPRMPLRCVA